MKDFTDLNTDYLYKAEPTDFVETGVLAYHCKNWVFRLTQESDGDYYMHYTYWKLHDEHPIKVTEDNIQKFTPLFDINKVEKIPDTHEKFMRELNKREEQRRKEQIIERMKHPQIDPDILNIDSKEDLIEFILEHHVVDDYKDVYRLELDLEKKKLRQLIDTFLH
ncbi:hypothetical protein [Staphylococcus equorum]|uniref:Uncharacterized protein n=1 Tax=Staphylococcus equorum TaxID=246432 RepID=A0AAP7LV17_9STAP|nr:hypothetical protein [Staphylococcus equorum]OEK58909.1 hypothetical protein ASS94_00880 [Staphylococcus equorum]